MHINITTTLEVDVALCGYYIHITLVDLYVYIRIVTDLYRIVLVITTGVCIDEHSHATIYCCTMIAFDVGEVVACDKVVVVLLDLCDLTTIRVYLVP